MIDAMLKAIRKKTREEYEEVVFTGVTNLRIWVQENAEKAAVLFLLVGFIIPFFFKTILLLLGLLVVTAFVVWTIAGAPADRFEAKGAASSEWTGAGNGSENGPASESGSESSPHDGTS